MTIHFSSEKELEFSLFCLDFVAQKLDKPVPEIYQKLKESGLLQDYIIDQYPILHTLGKDYLVDDLIRLMKEKDLL